MDDLDIQIKIVHCLCGKGQFYSHFLLIMYLLMKIILLADILFTSINRRKPSYCISNSRIIVLIIQRCAPCQPFSKYSQRYRKDGQVDDKWRLLYSFARIIQETTPHIVSMENVPELSTQTVFRAVNSRICFSSLFSVTWKLERNIPIPPCSAWYGTLNSTHIDFR